MVRGNGTHSRLQIGIVIRDILLEKHEVYGQELHKMVKQRTGRKLTYSSFMSNYVNKLKHLQFILPTRTEPSKTPGFKPRQYFRIRPGTENMLEMWRDPQKKWQEIVKDYEKRKQQHGTR